MPQKTAVLLLQMGGPDSLDAVRPFLLNLFSDRDLVKIGPRFLQPIVARRIARKRARHVELQYEKIGGKSPLGELTDVQARALEKRLGGEFRCFVAMRYWHPSTIEALAAARREGLRRIVGLSLYPQYSRATAGSSFNELDRVLRESPAPFELRRVESFFDNPAYIAALAEKITEELSRFPDPSRVVLLFSAHSLPVSFIDQGDPYLFQTEETVRLVMSRFPGFRHRLAFQSKAGPARWLEPDVREVMRELAAENCRDVLIVPVSFVSDHIETLYEIDIELAVHAESLGIANFHRVPALNSAPAFIDCLAELVGRLV
jgi:ferrochelatase